MKKIDEKNRMKQLLSSFKQKGEVYLEQKENKVEDSLLKEEYARLKKNACINEQYFTTGDYNNQGIGQTVNSIAGQTGSKEPLIPGKPTFAVLEPKEALEVAIRRTLRSGTPINDISFYDEVNWNLNTLGFPSKLPLDIKNAINELIK